jgi:hypothetical protein
VLFTFLALALIGIYFEQLVAMFRRWRTGAIGKLRDKVSNNSAVSAGI